MNSLYQTLSRMSQIQQNLTSMSSVYRNSSSETAKSSEAINTIPNITGGTTSNLNTLNSINPISALSGESTEIGVGNSSLNINATFLNQLQNDINNLNTRENSSTNKSYYDAIINRAATKYRLPESLIKSVIAVESNFNREAISPKGAMGLMQLMPTTAREYNVKEPYSPEENILAGTKHLRTLLDRNDNNLIRALAAYNAGEGALSENAVPNYRETQNYIKRVLDNYMKNNGVKL